MKKRNLLPILLCLASLEKGHASTVLYFQLEGVGAAPTGTGNDGRILDSSGNNFNGTASAYNGSGPTGPQAGAPTTGFTGVVPSYSSGRPGAVIRDGIGGEVVNPNNTSSMRFTNGGVSGNNYAASAGGQVKVADTGGSNSLLKAASFTIETFIKVDNGIFYSTFVGKERTGNSPTWQLDSNPSGSAVPNEPTDIKLRTRIDHQVSYPADGSTPAGTTAGSNHAFATGTNGSLMATTTGAGMEQGWHHIAMTYDDATKMVTMFVDYVSVGSGSLLYANDTDPRNDNLVYTDGAFVFGGGIGGRGFDGWMDEIRFSDSILTSGQFLRAEGIPEASHAMLLLTGLTAFGLRRRR